MSLRIIILLHICSAFFLLAVAEGTAVVFRGYCYNQDTGVSEGDTVSIRGATAESCKSRISSWDSPLQNKTSDIVNKHYVIKLDLPANCDFSWKWFNENTGEYEKPFYRQGNENRKLTVPDSSQILYVKADWNNPNNYTALVDGWENIGFRGLFPQSVSGNAAICGKFAPEENREASPLGWSCEFGAPVQIENRTAFALVKLPRINTVSKLNFYWKWRLLDSQKDDGYELINIASRQLPDVRNCTSSDILVVKSTFNYENQSYMCEQSKTSLTPVTTHLPITTATETTTIYSTTNSTVGSATASHATSSASPTTTAEATTATIISQTSIKEVHSTGREITRIMVLPNTATAASKSHLQRATSTPTLLSLLTNRAESLATLTKTPEITLTRTLTTTQSSTNPTADQKPTATSPNPYTGLTAIQANNSKHANSTISVTTKVLVNSTDFVSAKSSTVNATGFWPITPTHTFPVTSVTSTNKPATTALPATSRVNNPARDVSTKMHNGHFAGLLTSPYATTNSMASSKSNQTKLPSNQTTIAGTTAISATPTITTAKPTKTTVVVSPTIPEVSSTVTAAKSTSNPMTATTNAPAVMSTTSKLAAFTEVISTAAQTTAQTSAEPAPTTTDITATETTTTETKKAVTTRKVIIIVPAHGAYTNRRAQDGLIIQNSLTEEQIIIISVCGGLVILAVIASITVISICRRKHRDGLSVNGRSYLDSTDAIVITNPIYRGSEEMGEKTQD